MFYNNPVGIEKFINCMFRGWSLPFSQSAQDSVANDGIESSGDPSGACFRHGSIHVKNEKSGRNRKLKIEICECFGGSRCHFRNLCKILWRMMASRTLGTLLGPVFGMAASMAQNCGFVVQVCCMGDYGLQADYGLCTDYCQCRIARITD